MPNSHLTCCWGSWGPVAPNLYFKCSRGPVVLDLCCKMCRGLDVPIANLCTHVHTYVFEIFMFLNLCIYMYSCFSYVCACQ